MREIKPVESYTDLFRVCDIIKKAQEEETKKTGILYNTKGLVAEMLNAELIEKQGICLCAYEDSEPVGTLTVVQDNKRNWYSSQFIEKTIKYVAVDPKHQGKHIATDLIEYAKEQLSYEILSLSTGDNNKHAIHLYKKCGFLLMHVGFGPINNSYKFAYWKNGCPINRSVIMKHVLISRLKCYIKRIIFKITTKEELN